MISALRRLQQAKDPQPLPDEMAAFGISGAGLKGCLPAHPPLEERIAALQRG